MSQTNGKNYFHGRFRRKARICRQLCRPGLCECARMAILTQVSPTTCSTFSKWLTSGPMHPCVTTLLARGAHGSTGPHIYASVLPFPLPFFLSPSLLTDTSLSLPPSMELSNGGPREQHGRAALGHRLLADVSHH